MEEEETLIKKKKNLLEKLHERIVILSCTTRNKEGVLSQADFQ